MSKKINPVDHAIKLLLNDALQNIDSELYNTASKNVESALELLHSAKTLRNRGFTVK